VFREDAAGVARRGRAPGGAASGELVRRDIQIDRMPLRIDDDRVAVTRERDRSADRGLGRDVADDMAMRRAAEAAVGDQRDLLIETRADDGSGDREHLAHARPAARSLVADDDAVARFDASGDDRVERVLLALEAARGEASRGQRVTGDLHGPALGAERAG